MSKSGSSAGARRITTRRMGHNSSGPKKYGTMRPEMQQVELIVRAAEKHQDFMAQHGPVRVLFKDGKPVEP